MKTVIDISPGGPHFNMWLWCIDEFGREAQSKYFIYESDRWVFDDYCDDWYVYGFRIIFRDITDATLFKLTWL